MRNFIYSLVLVLLCMPLSGCTELVVSGVALVGSGAAGYQGYKNSQAITSVATSVAGIQSDIRDIKVKVGMTVPPVTTTVTTTVTPPVQQQAAAPKI